MWGIFDPPIRVSLIILNDPQNKIIIKQVF